MCRFRLLGPIEVRSDEGRLHLGGSRQLALLAFLVLNCGRTVPVDELVEQVWEDRPVDGAAKRAQVAIARLRRSLAELPGPHALVTAGAGYRLDLDPTDVDAFSVARRLEEARGALDRGRAAYAAEILRDALASWRGPALAEIADMPFAQREIARLEEMRLTVLETRVDADLRLGAHDLLIGELETLLAEHPARERLAARLMTSLYRAGRQAEALAVFQRTRARLVEEFGLDPGPELRKLQEQILHQDPSLGDPPAPRVGTDPNGAPVRAGAPAAARVPQPPNATVGREADIAAILARLRDRDRRLVTLTGPGGVGKTRVALEAARSAAGAFADGARFVSLAEVRRAGDVGAAILRALAIVPLGGESDESAVARFLGQKDLLLVLDNLEQVLPAASVIGRLLDATMGLTVLATSRAPLRLRAEECYPIAPLTLPDAKEPGDLDSLSRVAAVALFCERARARSPSFVLEAGNAVAVAQICRQVDGLPLALELAAARCGLLTPKQIADRLGAQRGGLSVGPRDAPARHATLHATIDWSHDLLSRDEQASFARFAVFAGGATVEAAETIIGASIDTLDGLVAQSLVMARRQDAAASRLYMLETTRAYAAERLAAAPDHRDVHARHHRFFLDLALEHGNDPALMRAERRDHLVQLDAESDNLDAALAWALREGGARRALELCGALGTYWAMRFRGPRMASAIDDALRLPGADHCVEARVAALLARFWSSGPASGSAAAVEAEALARAMGDPLLLARVLEARADDEVDRGDLDAAAALGAEALRQAQEAGDEWQIAAAWRVRARAARNGPDRREYVERAATALAAVGNLFDMANIFVSAAYGALRDASGRDAKEFAERAMPLVRELDDPFVWMNVQANAGCAALALGDLEAAESALRAALELSRRMVVRRIAAEMMVCLGSVAAIRGDIRRAARLVGAATAHAVTDPPDVVTPRLVGSSIEEARARSGPERWNADTRDGSALSLDAAIAYALQEHAPTSPAA